MQQTAGKGEKELGETVAGEKECADNLVKRDRQVKFERVLREDKLG